MVCVVCSCCATSPYREVCRAKGGIGSGETLCHDVYPARPITTVSLAANIPTAWWMAIAHAHLAPWAPGSNLVVRVNRAIDGWREHTAGGHLLSVVQAATYWASLNSVLANGHRLRRTPSNPLSCLRIWSHSIRRYNLDTMIRSAWASNPDSPITIAGQRILRGYQQRHRGRLWRKSYVHTKAWETLLSC